MNENIGKIIRIMKDVCKYKYRDEHIGTTLTQFLAIKDTNSIIKVNLDERIYDKIKDYKLITTLSTSK